ncbi:MAG TPA: alpha/beta hydrolase [Pseudonocardiaceae bacterium]|nr:alpha/beta hydrolase [Pseudonocardiaceae bacterium]
MSVTHVLVHGAWHGSWCWNKLTSELGDRPVRTVDLPSVGDAGAGLGDDAQVLRDAVTSVDGPVMVTAHSYGGMVASRALTGLANVRHIVYLCGFVLDEDVSLLSAAGGAPLPWWQVRDDGFVDPGNPERIFFNDLPPSAAATAAAALRPQSYRALEDKQSAAAWRTIPSTYLVATDDQALPADAQRAMAQHCGRKFELISSHSPFLSHPDYVASLLREIDDELST